MNKEIELEFTALTEGLPKVKISPERVQRAIDNLVNNSVDITVGWDFTCKSKDSQFTPIHCNKCGLNKLHTTKALVTMVYVCEGCAVENYRKLLAGFGYDYISNDKTGVKSACKVCGTHLLTAGHTIKAGNRPHCETCHTNTYKRFALDNGFTYLGKYSSRRTGTQVRLQCNLDGNQLQVNCGDLVKGLIRCRICLETKYKKHLALKDCTFISVEHKSVNGNLKTRITYSNKEGDVFESTSGNVLHGKFTSTKKSSWYQKHQVYLIINEYEGDTYCKIGTANIAELRLKNLKLSGNTSVAVLAEFDSRFEADALESKLHNEFKQFKLSEEVSTIFSNAWKIARNSEGVKYSRKDGISEWFTSEVKAVLVDRYKLD